MAWIVAQLDVLGVAGDGGRIDETTGLFGRGVGLDSIEVLQLVAAMEERFDVTVEDEELDPERFRTVGSLATFIEEKRAWASDRS